MKLQPVAGMLLIALSACLLMAGHNRALVPLLDPVIGISNCWVLWGIGGASGIVGAICVFATYEQLTVSLVAWFCSCLLIYRTGYFFLGIVDPQAYVAMTASDYGVSSRTFLLLLTTAVVCLGYWSWLGVVMVLMREKGPGEEISNGLTKKHLTKDYTK